MALELFILHLFPTHDCCNKLTQWLRTVKGNVLSHISEVQKFKTVLIERSSRCRKDQASSREAPIPCLFHLPVAACILACEVFCNHKMDVGILSNVFTSINAFASTSPSRVTLPSLRGCRISLCLSKDTCDCTQGLPTLILTSKSLLNHTHIFPK